MLEHCHNTVVQVAAILVFVLLLGAKEHISHSVVDVSLTKVLNLEQHDDYLRLFQSVVDFLLLALCPVVYHFSFCRRLFSTLRDPELFVGRAFCHRGGATANPRGRKGKNLTALILSRR